MFYLFRLLRSGEWRSWSRRKKIAAVAIILLISALIALIPDMAVFAGVVDASLLDVVITLLGIQLLLYSDQIKAYATLAVGASTRYARKMMHKNRPDDE